MNTSKRADKQKTYKEIFARLCFSRGNANKDINMKSLSIANFSCSPNELWCVCVNNTTPNVRIFSHSIVLFEFIRVNTWSNQSHSRACLSLIIVNFGLYRLNLAGLLFVASNVSRINYVHGVAKVTRIVFGSLLYISTKAHIWRNECKRWRLLCFLSSSCFQRRRQDPEKEKRVRK